MVGDWGFMVKRDEKENGMKGSIEFALDILHKSTMVATGKLADYVADAEKELFELRSKEVGKSRIELYREIFDLVDYIKHIAGISNTSVQHYWPDTCETCKEIRLELEKNDSRINRLLSLLED